MNAKISSTDGRRRQAAGFTLFEVLVSIAILLILSTLAVPSFTNFIAGQRVKAASFDLMSGLTLARSEAIKRNATAAGTTDIAPTGGSWANGWTVSVWDTTLVTPARTTVGAHEALSGVTVTCVSAGAPAACATMSYLGTGRLASTTVMPSLQVGSPSTTTVRCIVTNLSGQPSSQTGACS